MANKDLGELRRSTAVMTFGPGSIIDFRADGAPISAVAAGLEEWDRSFPPPGLKNPQIITEPRLQRKLLVDGFRLPPVTYQYRQNDNSNSNTQSLVAARFPNWLQCPDCDRLAPANKWGESAGMAYRYCVRCTNQAPGQRRVFTVPTRFVISCRKGHLDDFPWHTWVNHVISCKKKERADLYLRSVRPGLSGLVLSCSECDAKRSLDGIFSSQIIGRFKCRGKRPWLAVDNEECDSAPRALQRGASNLYFPLIESALSIPPWSDALQTALGTHWNTIVATKAKDRADLIRILGENEDALKPVLIEFNLTPSQLTEEVERRISLYHAAEKPNIRQEEFRQFISGIGTDASEKREFEVRNMCVPEKLGHYFSHLVRVVRLREVRALRGFTRIDPPGDENSPEVASISVDDLRWLPAIEVRGEGIFLSFNLDTLRTWETQDSVKQRAQKIDTAWQVVWNQRYGEGKPTWRITPRYLLTHTFAHALICQLTLECGYSTAALRERIYVNEGIDEGAGLLIYTATSDSDGTLGGLQRQGEPERIERAVEAAIINLDWCSSDPLCIEGLISGADRLSLAACHACVLVPETACEHYNQFLDRATLVGLPNAAEVGFFAPLIQPE